MYQKYFEFINIYPYIDSCIKINLNFDDAYIRLKQYYKKDFKYTKKQIYKNYVLYYAIINRNLKLDFDNIKYNNIKKFIVDIYNIKINKIQFLDTIINDLEFHNNDIYYEIIDKNNIDKLDQQTVEKLFNTILDNSKLNETKTKTKTKSIFNFIYNSKHQISYTFYKIKKLYDYSIISKSLLYYITIKKLKKDINNNISNKNNSSITSNNFIEIMTEEFNCLQEIIKLDSKLEDYLTELYFKFNFKYIKYEHGRSNLYNNITGNILPYNSSSSSSSECNNSSSPSSSADSYLIDYKYLAAQYFLDFNQGDK